MLINFSYNVETFRNPFDYFNCRNKELLNKISFEI